jgi:hypothetical protein
LLEVCTLGKIKTLIGQLWFRVYGWCALKPLTLEVYYLSFVWRLQIALYKSLFLLVFSFVGDGGLGAVFFADWVDLWVSH